MALTITGRYEIPAARQEVWDIMLEPEVLRACIPGCSELEALDDTHYRATVTTKISAIRATFKGQVELSEIDSPNSILLSGTGEGGIAGFAKGGATIRLSDGEAEGTTILEYEGDVAIGGKLAQLGSRLVAGVAKKLSDQFFDNLVARMTQQPA